MTDRNLGRKLANRYELIKPIGQGAMGTIYLAKDTRLGGVLVAVKLLSQDVLNEQTFKRFQTEAKISALLGHKCRHIVRVLDQQLTQEGHPFYVMEYLEGKNISQVIRAQSLSLTRFLELARQTCLALKTAHTGILLNNKVVKIIHRDIKPSNILVTQAEAGDLVKVLDFGIAKLLQADNTDDSRYMGTMAYSSPEQIDDQVDGQELDQRSDIYSLGITMYEMLTGTLPYKPQRNNFSGWHKAHITYNPKPLQEMILVGTSPELLNGVHNLVMSCLAKNRDHRPASVDKILDILIDLQQEASSSGGSQIVVPAQDKQKPVATEKSPDTVADLDWFLRSQTWPSTISTKEASLPKLLTFEKKHPLVTLWIMLSPQEITRRINNSRYNTFLCTMHPHPMVLWVTAFRDDVYGYRWFSNYLNLKEMTNRQKLWLLSEQRSYHGLLFSTQTSNAVTEICKFNIAQTQCNLLKEWVIKADTIPSIGMAQKSEFILKNEFEKLKKRGF